MSLYYIMLYYIILYCIISIYICHIIPYIIPYIIGDLHGYSIYNWWYSWYNPFSRSQRSGSSDRWYRGGTLGWLRKGHRTQNNVAWKVFYILVMTKMEVFDHLQSFDHINMWCIVWKMMIKHLMDNGDDPLYMWIGRCFLYPLVIKIKHCWKVARWWFSQL